MAMGWEPVEREDGTTIWVRSKDIGVDDVPYCDTALAVAHLRTLRTMQLFLNLVVTGTIFVLDL